MRTAGFACLILTFVAANLPAPASSQSLTGCICRQEVVYAEGTFAVWRCAGYTCYGTCNCLYPNVTYEAFPPGESAGACDSTCSDDGCEPEYSGFAAKAAAPGKLSAKLSAAQAPGGDDAAKFGFPVGAGTDNRHLGGVKSGDGWFVKAGDVRLRLFFVEVQRTGRNGAVYTRQIPLGYEAAAGDEAEGEVVAVRPLEVVSRLDEAPATAVVDGFYQVSVRRRPNDPVQIYTVRTASSLATK